MIFSHIWRRSARVRGGIHFIDELDALPQVHHYAITLLLAEGMEEEEAAPQFRRSRRRP